jgi:hypothetical protein
MEEHVARDVVLVRAIETSDTAREILSDEDRTYASRSARELARWHAADAKAEVTSEHFLQQRAEQILKRLAERSPSVRSFLRWRRGLGPLALILPFVAFLAGVGIDRIADPHHVDLLSAPLILIIGWNLLVYIVMLAWLCIPAARPYRWHAALERALGDARKRLPRKLPQVLASALASFMEEWSRMSAKLTSARISRVLHASAAMFAVGAVLSLYARGLVTDYAVGWESTFLDAKEVHLLLSCLFAPVNWLFRLDGFSLQEIGALRFGGAPASAAGARWVHLYAATMLLFVVLPRLVLAAMAHWRVRHLMRNFPLDLNQPYFRRLQQELGGAPGLLRVLPYSFTVDEARDRGLNIIADMMLGTGARVMLRPPVSYGDEPAEALRGTDTHDNDVTMTAVLFNLAATPEKENHGAFLDHLVGATGGKIAVLIDESAYLERFKIQNNQDRRLAERISLWKDFCRFHGAPAKVINLIQPAARPLDHEVST